MLYHKSLFVLPFLLIFVSANSQSLDRPESIVLDTKNTRYLVSNSGDGVLRSVDMDGSIRSFGTDASGSHGLAISDGFVYSCLRDVVFVHDLDLEVKVAEYQVEGAKFLNGLCISRGHLYVTDFSNRKIFDLELDPSSGYILSQQDFTRSPFIPNGILVDENKDELLVVTWGSSGQVEKYDLSTHELIERIPTGYSNLEGITKVDGSYYISAWSPSAIIRFEENWDGPWEVEDLSIERPTGLIEGIDGELLILSTEMSSLGMKSVKNTDEQFQISAFPNPVTVNSLITYTLERPGHVDIRVHDSKGVVVQNLVNEKKDAGTHSFFYDKADIEPGLYFINISTTDANKAIALTLMD